jgi:O-antigen ligase
MAFVVLSECNPRQAVETILRRTAYILIPFSVLLIKYFPHLGVEFGRWNGARMWVGVSSQKNGLAVVCSVAILFLVWTFVRRWQQERNLLAGGRPAYADLIVLLVALYLLLFPEGKASATSISALGVGVAVLLSLFFRPRLAAPLPKGALVSCVITLIGMGIALPLTGGSFASGFTAALGRDSTLTGRTETWAEIVPLAMSHPILGCGFDSYWTPMTRELHRMSHAHSAYLEMFNELGSLGLLFFTCFAVSFALQSTSSSGFGWKSLCISFLVMALVRGFTESGINSFTSQLGGILVLMSFLLSGQRSCNEWQT